MSYPIIICEDNPLHLKKLNTLIDNYILFHENSFKLALSASKPEDILDYINHKRPLNGTYFLDIDLNANVDGIELAEKIRKYDLQANIIFTTTHDEMAPVTLKRKVAAINFIEKDKDISVYRDNIYETLSYIRKNTNSVSINEKSNFTFTVGNQLFNFNQSEVISISSSDIPHRLDLSTTNGKYEFYDKLNDLEKKFPYLLRINRSCLINPINIQKVNFSTRDIILKNGDIKKISIGKSKKIKKALNAILLK